MKVEAALLRLGCLEFTKNDPLNEEALLSLDEIHPIFDPSNWLPVPSPELRHQGYINMRPALALATKLITSEMTMGWWIHTLYGKLSRHEKSGRWYLADDPRELNLEQAKLDVEAKFSELSKIVQFYWIPRIDGKDDPAGSPASMASYSPYDVMGYFDKERFPLGAVKDGRFLPTIGVDVLFLQHLTHSPGTPQLSQDSNLRLQFYIAVILVHELAHVF
jgi:hypothetical protein